MTMNPASLIHPGATPVYRNAALAALVWTLALAASLAWNISLQREKTIDLAKSEALANINKDFAFRQWATAHGGVYVPVDPATNTYSNPYLEVPERDIQTPSGRNLTLMNPAYMVRQMQQNFDSLYGVRGRITSLKPLNPNNAPDEWETRVLKSFERGGREAAEVTTLGGEPYLRAMRAFMTEKGCLKCHEHQGYKVGDVRGGVGAYVRMEPYLAAERTGIRALSITHGGIWLLGMAGLAFIMLRGAQRAREQEQAALALARKTRDLARSNAELEQFAYIASHDLQEPLRMVSSYTRLLARRYQGKLDQDADEFIAFAVDGATRMQRLIDDLLAFSRVGTRGKPFEPTDCNAVLKDVLDNLQLAIEENHAVVTRGELPVLPADASQLEQLFQNLIANAIKFHGEAPPQISIAAQQQADDWHFTVSDNGIGIDPEHFERIFVIFQRLHGRGDYPGTGIGLAVCKRIVERHGGNIWVESVPGQGATFHFTLPAAQRDTR
jgi:signal transduction histidine kinase